MQFLETWEEPFGLTHRFRDGVDDPGEANSVIELLLLREVEKKKHSMRIKSIHKHFKIRQTCVFLY